MYLSINQSWYMMNKIEDIFDHVDILVNNAMIGRYFLKPFLELTWNDFNGKFYGEIKAAYEISRVTLPNMMKHNYGRMYALQQTAPNTLISQTQ